MNDRAEYLANQAREHARAHVDQCKFYGYQMESNEYEIQFQRKFLELVVHECANIVNNLTEHEGLDDCYIAGYIKDHFGVDR